MKLKTGEVEKYCQPIRLPTVISTAQEPSRTKREGRHSMNEEALSNGQPGNANTHVNMFNSF